MNPIRTKFETGLQVYSDDIDTSRHVHSLRNLDYVWATGFDQMKRGHKCRWANSWR